MDIVGDTNVIARFTFELNWLAWLGGFFFRCLFLCLNWGFLLCDLDRGDNLILLRHGLFWLWMFLLISNVMRQLGKGNTICHKLGREHSQWIIHGKKIVYFHLLEVCLVVKKWRIRHWEHGEQSRVRVVQGILDKLLLKEKEVLKLLIDDCVGYLIALTGVLACRSEWLGCWDFLLRLQFFRNCGGIHRNSFNKGDFFYLI